MGNNNVEAQGGNHNGMGCCQFPGERLKNPQIPLTTAKCKKLVFQRRKRRRRL
jgi:hypothetical protein